MNSLHFIIWTFMAIFMGVGLGYYLGKRPKYIKVKEGEHLPHTLMPLDIRKAIKPFAKPSGKISPKVNDDSSAWKKEQDS